MQKRLVTVIVVLALVMTSMIPVFAESEEMSGISGSSQIEEQQNANIQSLNDVGQNTTVDEDEDPAIISYSATSPEFQTLRIEWNTENASRVKVYISADSSMQGISPTICSSTDVFEKTIPRKNKWKTTYVKMVPYKGTVEGAPVEFSIDIFDEYKPASVKLSKEAYTYEDGFSASDVIITDKAGRTIPADSIAVVKRSSRYTGENTVTIMYSGIYSGLPDFDIKYTLLPPVPTRFSPLWTEKNKIEFSLEVPKWRFSDADKYCDYAVIEWSETQDFADKNSMKVQRDTDDSKMTMKSLEKNTTYYVRAKTVKEIGNTKLASSWYYTSVKTAGTAPSASRSNKTTRSIISKMRKNKTFTAKLPQNISYSDACAYVSKIRDKRPHLNKFNVAYVRAENGGYTISHIEFKYDKKKAKVARALNKKLMPIVRKAKKKKGTRAKVIYVNDAICKTCSYHMAAYKAHQRGDYSKYKHCHDAYGCLVQHKAVCSGYTDAFAAIMTELNIKNGYGHFPNHIWNKVKIGKKWYHVDVTWNDCTHSDKYLLKKSHPKK